MGKSTHLTQLAMGDQDQVMEKGADSRGFTRTGKGGRFCPPLMFFVNIFRSIRSIAVIMSVPAKK